MADTPLDTWQHRLWMIESRWLYVKQEHSTDWGGAECNRMFPLFQPFLQAIYYIENVNHIKLVFDGEMCHKLNRNLREEGIYNLRQP